MVQAKVLTSNRYVVARPGVVTDGVRAEMPPISNTLPPSRVTAKAAVRKGALEELTRVTMFDEGSKSSTRFKIPEEPSPAIISWVPFARTVEAHRPRGRLVKPVVAHVPAVISYDSIPDKIRPEVPMPEDPRAIWMVTLG